MDLGLKGKTALITGTGSQIGYGKAIAITLAEEGCRIISGDIDLDGARKTADEVEAMGHEALAVKADVSNRAEVDDMVEAIRESAGGWLARYLPVSQPPARGLKGV